MGRDAEHPRHLFKAKHKYTANTTKNYDLIFEFISKTIKIFKDLSYIIEVCDAIAAESDLDKMIPRVELIADSIDGTIKSLNEFNKLMKNIKDNNIFATEYLEITDQEISEMEDTVDVFRDLKKDLEDIVVDYKQNINPNYISVKDQMFIHENVPRPSTEITPNELATFFSSFDKDNSGTIDVDEGQAFYYWVEENILYRYDDENAVDPFPG